MASHIIHRWLLSLSYVSVLLLATVTGTRGPGLMPRGNNSTKQPNILFVLTDDQDLHMDSLSYMPLLQKYIIDQGTTYTQHYCTVSLCCPSRVSMWTGKAAHNTNVTSLSPPYGKTRRRMSANGVELTRANQVAIPCLWRMASTTHTCLFGFNRLGTAHTMSESS